MWVSTLHTHPHITAIPNFTIFSTHVACSPSPVTLPLDLATLRHVIYFRFLCDVIFAVIGLAKAKHVTSVV